WDPSISAASPAPRRARPRRGRSVISSARADPSGRDLAPPWYRAAPGGGIEPPFGDPKSPVLPLDDPGPEALHYGGAETAIAPGRPSPIRRASSSSAHRPARVGPLPQRIACTAPSTRSRSFASASSGWRENTGGSRSFAPSGS